MCSGLRTGGAYYRAYAELAHSSAAPDPYLPASSRDPRHSLSIQIAMQKMIGPVGSVSNGMIEEYNHNSNRKS